MKRPSGPAIAVIVLVIVVLLPALYVLSYGPAVWLNGYGYIGYEPAATIYAPLECLYNVPVAGDALKWYSELWSPSSYIRPPPITTAP